MKLTRKKPKASELLREAADDLEVFEFPPGARVVMSVWGENPTELKPKLNNLCGTTACIAGWLSLRPKWRKRGFTSKWLKSLYDETWELWPGKCDEDDGWCDMAESVFGVDHGGLHRIFYNTGSLDLAISRLRKLSQHYEDAGR